MDIWFRSGRRSHLHSGPQPVNHGLQTINEHQYIPFEEQKIYILGPIHLIID